MQRLGITSDRNIANRSEALVMRDSSRQITLGKILRKMSVLTDSLKNNINSSSVLMKLKFS